MHEVILPLRPIIPGFAADAAIYTFLAMTLFELPAAIRRLIRRRRGRCPRCGYPIGASPLCSECGQAVRPLAAS